MRSSNHCSALQPVRRIGSAMAESRSLWLGCLEQGDGGGILMADLFGRRWAGVKVVKLPIMDGKTGEWDQGSARDEARRNSRTSSLISSLNFPGTISDL